MEKPWSSIELYQSQLWSTLDQKGHEEMKRQAHAGLEGSCVEVENAQTTIDDRPSIRRGLRHAMTSMGFISLLFMQL